MDNILLLKDLRFVEKISSFCLSTTFEMI